MVGTHYTNTKQPIDSSFPESKISEIFLEFYEPILDNESGSLTAEEIEQDLSIAFAVWNTRRATGRTNTDVAVKPVGNGWVI